jgi:hypothetical protein
LYNCAKRNLRILTISDRQFDSTEQTIKYSSLVAEKFKGKFNVNSQAVRYFISTCQPDTRGLASLLQFSTKIRTLEDINAKLFDEEIIKECISFIRMITFPLQLN